MPYSSPQSALVKSFGGFGSIFVNSTGVYTGSFCAIQAIEDCRFLSLTSTDMENASAWVSSNQLLPAGMLIAANFTSVSVTGVAMLYKH